MRGETGKGTEETRREVMKTGRDARIDRYRTEETRREVMKTGRDARGDRYRDRRDEIGE
jgi:hypothetical protein